MNKIILKIFGILILLPVFTIAQKKSLSHDDYDNWNRIEDWDIGQKGNYSFFQIDPQEGDGKLYLHNNASGEDQIFERGYRAELSYEENYFIFRVKPKYEETREAKRKEWKKNEMPQDHLVIFNTITGELDTVKNVSNFKMPEESEGYVAVLLADYKKKEKKKGIEEEAEEGEEKKEVETEEKEKPESDKKEKKKLKDNMLLVLDLKSDKVDTLHYVDEYVFGKTSARLVYTQKVEKNDSIKGVFSYFKGTEELIDTAGKSFSRISINEAGNMAAWLVTNDSSDSKTKEYELRYSDLLNEVHVVSPDSEGIPKGNMPSPYSTPVFDKLDSYLFFNTTKIPEKIDEDTMALKEEKVNLDIWSWTDTIIQPMQLKNLDRDKEKSYLAVLHLDNEKIVQLESPSLDVRYDSENVTEWLAASDDRTSRKSLSWDYPRPEDLYLININTGERKLVKQNSYGSGSVSPDGKYYYWYDRQEQNWNCMDVESGSTVVLNKFKYPVYDVEHDAPSLAGSYGIAGWTKGDKEVLIYDQFDIWKVNPNDTENPVCLTSGKGREEEKRYRYYRLDRDLKHLPENESLVEIFNKKTKQSGFVKIDFNKTVPNMSDEILMGDHSFNGIKKSKNSDKLLFRKGNFVNYPEVYLSDFEFANYEVLSRTNPQQEEYIWGTAELVDWKAKGNKLQGILYKPENFDPNKKYPMMVYFYERYSDMLNYHFGFAPSASTINFAYFVSNGYLVFVPDIVYKDGKPGQSAYNCVVSGTKELMKRSYVDSKKMAIQGQSWGGYQVAHLVTRTNLYACAMAGAPVSNMTSAYGGIRWGSGMSRQFQYEKSQSRIGATLWEDRDLYIENSPLFYADQVETPLLIMHNDNDGAVPWYQGIEYFMALRRLNKPAWMLVYNNEAHNLRKRHNRKDLSVRMSQFFDHYLKGAPAPEWMILGRSAVEKDTNDGMELMEKD